MKLLALQDLQGIQKRNKKQIRKRNSIITYKSLSKLSPFRLKLIRPSFPSVTNPELLDIIASLMGFIRRRLSSLTLSYLRLLMLRSWRRISKESRSWTKLLYKLNRKKNQGVASKANYQTDSLLKTQSKNHKSSIQTTSTASQWMFKIISTHPSHHQTQPNSSTA